MIRIGNKVVAGSADVDLSTVLKSLNKTGLSVWVGTQTEYEALSDTIKNNDKTTFITYDTDEDVYLIIDTIVSYGKTWSSVKISSELAKKINASDVYTKEQVDDIINAKLASALKYRGAVNTTALLPGSAENGDTYFVKADGFMYAYNSTTSVWDALGTVADMTNYFTKTEITAMLQDKADKFQYDVLPTASSETVGLLLQYTGADTQDYKNGYFYKGIDNGNGTYAWELAKVGEYEEIIDDEITSVNTTWSSDKISNSLVDYDNAKVRELLTSGDLNTVVTEGIYSIGHLNRLTNAPNTNDEHGILRVTKSANGIVCQEWISRYLGTLSYRVQISSGAWESWHELATMDKIDYEYPYRTDITDANNAVVKNGSAYYTLNGTTCTNLPNATNAFLVEWHSVPSTLSSNSYGYQRAVIVGNVRVGGEFIRYRNSTDGSWSAWQEIATMDKVESIVKYSGTIRKTVNSGYIQIDNPLGKSCFVVCAPQYISTELIKPYVYIGQATPSNINIYIRQADGSLPPDGTDIFIAYVLI